MRIFFIVWIGQLISLLGSKLTEFALGFWILEKTYQQNGTITEFAFTIFLIYLPKVIVSPIAGVFIDHWNRRYAMILSDLVAGLMTITIFMLFLSGNLRVWHIYLAVTITSTFNAFQLPAYTAAISQLVPMKNFGRANGMVQASNGVAKIVSPFIAGLLLKTIGLQGILSIDIVTFLVAVFSLSVVRFPKIKRQQESTNFSAVRLWNDINSGWKYISFYPGLKRLLSFISISYFTTSILEVTLWALLFQPDSKEQLGTILSIGGCGMLAGSVLMSFYGEIKNRVLLILCCVGLQGLVSFVAGLRISLVVVAIGIFLYLFSQPIIISSNQAIWQKKTPNKLQGRVFALQQSLEKGLAIVAYLIAGPLVDKILTPLTAEGTTLSNFLSPLLSTGIDRGKGIALLLLLMGLLNITAVAIACNLPRLLYLEKELPDN